MALLKSPVSVGKCPKCGSTNVKLEYRKLASSKASMITKKWIKCNDCGFEG